MSDSVVSGYRTGIIDAYYFKLHNATLAHVDFNRNVVWLVVGSYVATNLKIVKDMTVTCTDGDLEILMGKGLTTFRYQGKDKFVFRTSEIKTLVSLLQTGELELAKLYETKETDQEATNPVSWSRSLWTYSVGEVRRQDKWLSDTYRLNPINLIYTLYRIKRVYTL